jgi:hypothetical protein
MSIGRERIGQTAGGQEGNDCYRICTAEGLFRVCEDFGNIRFEEATFQCVNSFSVSNSLKFPT